MLVTPAIDRHNRRCALTVSAAVAVAGGLSAWFYPPLVVSLALVPVGFWLIRRQCVRRMAVAWRPFPPQWGEVLECRVRFYRALDDARRERFRRMVAVFLDEVRVTGIRTEVDDVARLPAARRLPNPAVGTERKETG